MRHEKKGTQTLTHAAPRISNYNYLKTKYVLYMLESRV